MKRKKNLNLDVAQDEKADQDETSDIKHVCLLTSRVVYTHPARRYYVEEFLSLVTGERWREARWFPLEPQTDLPQRKPHFDFTKKLDLSDKGER